MCYTHNFFLVLFLGFADVTLRFRHEVAWKFMSIFAPKLCVDVQSLYNYHRWNEIPRPFTLFLKERFKHRVDGVVGCEIGFGLGDNAVSLEKELNVSKLFSVDPFYGRDSYVDAYGYRVEIYVNHDDDIKRNFERLCNTEFLMMTSDDAFKVLPFGLDFVYVDGNHAFEFVYRDIKNALAHVRVGGFVGGHDFGSRSFEVTEAVFAVAREVGQVPYVDVPDFWFVKQ